MFDIKEYYQKYNYNPDDIHNEIADINDDISNDIDNLIKNSFNSLYLQDRYKYKQKYIDIIYPKLKYPGNHSQILNPNKVRFLLSFYPKKSDLNYIDRIIFRPRYIESDNIELVSLYLNTKKTLVLYITHPHNYTLDSTKFKAYSEFISVDLEKILNNKLMGNVINIENDNEIQVHPLWYILSIISQNRNPGFDYSNENKIEKFFIKRGYIDDTMYESLNNTSFFYSHYGY
ncbi:hypothetical protein ACFL20_03950 [Spirochaetota bacterium]